MEKLDEAGLFSEVNTAIGAVADDTLRELHTAIGHHTARNEQMYASILQALRMAAQIQAEQQAEVSALTAQLQMVKAQFANMAYNRQ